MKLEHSEVTSRYYAKQVIEAINKSGEMHVYKYNDDVSITTICADEVLDILFPEEADNA